MLFLVAFMLFLLGIAGNRDAALGHGAQVRSEEPRPPADRKAVKPGSAGGARRCRLRSGSEWRSNDVLPSSRVMKESEH